MNEKKLKFDVNQIADIAHRGTRRAAAFIGLGEKAWGDETIHSVKLQVPFPIQLLPDPLPKELAEEVRHEFRKWLTGNAVAELMQGLALFADAYYEAAALAERHGKEVGQETLNRIRKFKNDTNFASKLKTIETDCKIKSQLLDHADGWARARNAHAHNQGIVRPRDCDPDAKELTVSWREFEFLIDGEKIDNIIGYRVEKEGLLSFKLSTGKHKFAVGDPLNLEVQQISNIFLTTYLGVQSMCSELHKRLLEIVAKDQ